MTYLYHSRLLLRINLHMFSSETRFWRNHFWHRANEACVCGEVYAFVVWCAIFGRQIPNVVAVVVVVSLRARLPRCLRQWRVYSKGPNVNEEKKWYELLLERQTEQNTFSRQKWIIVEEKRKQRQTLCAEKPSRQSKVFAAGEWFLVRCDDDKYLI